ncbi:MAG: beta-hydroxyacyl-ACP dehydratase [Candidatus Riflebacteria bacterium]|nr:beta-hydroxyacyl-ACP dehydratase [Candidatus Riflebacteria bacterium]
MPELTEKRGNMRFFLIDRITQWEIGKEAKALKNISLSEDFFNDHFPRRPVMPGVLILEGMAQLAGLLVEASLKEKFGKDAKAVVSIIERVKFRNMVKPGDTLQYSATLLSLNEIAGKAKVEAYLNSRLLTGSEMVFSFKQVDDPKLDEWRVKLMKMWMQND